MKVSIIMPTYKRLHYLKTALVSVIEQTYHNWECIVINDYPPDAIAISNLIQTLNHSHIRLINHQLTQGGNAARNTGIKNATGEIIAFLDDDDFWLVNKLEKHVTQHYNNPNVGLIFSGVTQVWEQKNLPSKTTLASLPQLQVTEAMSQGLFCPHTSSAVTVLSKCFFDCGLFDESLVSFQDWDMWFRIAQVYAFTCVSDALVIFQQHLGDRTSQSVKLRLQGLQQILTKWQTKIKYPQQFQNTFTKEVYLTQIQNLLLQKQRKKAFFYGLKFLKISHDFQDILQLTKLVLLFIFGLNFYGLLLQRFRLLRQSKVAIN